MAVVVFAQCRDVNRIVRGGNGQFDLVNLSRRTGPDPRWCPPRENRPVSG